jgi:hypothetical protein
MPPIDWIASLVAAVSTFILGGIWYSPLLFAKPWQQDAGLSDEQLKTSNKGKIFTVAFIWSLLAAATFSMFLGPDPSLNLGLGAGATAGIFWVAGSFAISYQLKPNRLLLINGGYHAMQFTLFGLVFALL